MVLRFLSKALERIRKKGNPETKMKNTKDVEIDYKKLEQNVNKELLKRSGVFYTQLAERLAHNKEGVRKHCKYVFDLTNNPNHLILFPLNGSLFNYYFAEGMIRELKARGLDNGIRARTILTPRVSGSEDIYTKFDTTRIINQFDKIYSARKFDSYSFVDAMAFGRTRKILAESMQSFAQSRKKKITLKNNLSALDYQHLVANDELYGIDELVLPKEYVDNKGYLAVSADKEKAEWQLEQRRAIKGLLLYFGRASMRLYLQGLKEKIKFSSEDVDDSGYD